MKAPRLTKNAAGDFDLLIENGKVPFIEDGGQAAQHAGQRILIFKGEYSLGGVLTTKTELGTKFYEVVFDVGKSRAEKELELKRRTFGPGVEKILSFTLTQQNHTTSIVSRIKTEWGAEDISTEVTQL